MVRINYNSTQGYPSQKSEDFPGTLEEARLHAIEKGCTRSWTYTFTLVDYDAGVTKHFFWNGNPIGHLNKSNEGIKMKHSTRRTTVAVR